MSKYVYPAVFLKEKKGYSVDFPDLPGCYTCGDDLGDAIYMAEDVLAFTLYSMDKRGEEIPAPSVPNRIKHPKGSFVNYIKCDTLDYKKKHCNKAVKKTLTIPEWLNEAATEAGINFSQVLQDALKEILNIA